MDINRICFNPDNYENKNEMWRDIAIMMQTLLKNQYVVVTNEEDFGVVVMEYEHNERTGYYGCVNPYWITEEEYNDVLVTREAKGEVEE